MRALYFAQFDVFLWVYIACLVNGILEGIRKVFEECSNGGD